MLSVRDAVNALKSGKAFNKKVSSFRAVLNPHGELMPQQRKVLSALRSFCHIGVIDHGSDPIKMARIVGRREVYDWVMNNISLEEIELYELEKQIREYEDE